MLSVITGTVSGDYVVVDISASYFEQPPLSASGKNCMHIKQSGCGSCPGNLPIEIVKLSIYNLILYSV